MSGHIELLESFLNRWDINAIKKMKIDQYTGINNKDTFTYWVENKTKLLGGIQGMPSQKFGIFERGNPTKKPKRVFLSDNKYNWYPKLGKNKNEAFATIKKYIIDISQYAMDGDFEKIESIPLPTIYKWKVAYLYSNERLVPIFKKSALYDISKHLLGSSTKNKKNI